MNANGVLNNVRNNVTKTTNRFGAGAVAKVDMPVGFPSTAVATMGLPGSTGIPVTPLGNINKMGMLSASTAPVKAALGAVMGGPFSAGNPKNPWMTPAGPGLAVTGNGMLTTTHAHKRGPTINTILGPMSGVQRMGIAPTYGFGAPGPYGTLAHP